MFRGVIAFVVVSLVGVSWVYGQSRAPASQTQQDQSRAALALKCISFLASKIERKGSRYHIHKDTEHYYFYTGGTDINGSQAGTGFIQLTSQGARFCPANLPRGGAFKFQMGSGNEVLYPGERSTAQTANLANAGNLGELSERCRPTDDEMLRRMVSHVSSFVEAYVKSKGRASANEIQSEIRQACGNQMPVIQRALTGASPSPAAPSPSGQNGEQQD